MALLLVAAIAGGTSISLGYLAVSGNGYVNIRKL